MHKNGGTHWLILISGYFHGFDVNIDEIRKNVTNKDIDLFYEYHNLLKVKNV